MFGNNENNKIPYILQFCRSTRVSFGITVERVDHFSLRKFQFSSGYSGRSVYLQSLSQTRIQYYIIKHVYTINISHWSGPLTSRYKRNIHGFSTANSP